MANAKNSAGLNGKQKRFCDEYLIDENGTQAAIRAGYSERSAGMQASRMLSNVIILNYIEERKAQLNKQLEDKYLISKERVLKEQARVAFSDIRVYFDESGNLKDLNTLTQDEAAALSSIETEEIKSNGIVIGSLKKIKVYDKLRALDSIAKEMGYNAPEEVRVKTTVDISKYTAEEKATLLELALKRG